MRSLRVGLGLGSRLVLSVRRLGLEVHLEVVMVVCGSSRLSAVVFRCELPDELLVLLRGQ